MARRSMVKESGPEVSGPDLLFILAVKPTGASLPASFTGIYDLSYSHT